MHPRAMLDPQCVPFGRDFVTNQVAHLAQRANRVHGGQVVTTFWLNGSDAFYTPDLMSDAIFSSLPHPVRLLVLPLRASAKLEDDNFAKSKIPLSDYVWRADSSQTLDISSTRIRSLIAEQGALNEAADLIGDDLGAALTFFAFHSSQKAEAAAEEQRILAMRASEAASSAAAPKESRWLGGLFQKK